MAISTSSGNEASLHSLAALATTLASQSSCYSEFMTEKLREAIERLQQMPEDRQDLLAKLLLWKIEEAERQIEAGETVSHEEAKRRLEKWLTPPD